MTPRFVRPERLAVARARDGSLFVMPLPDGPPRALNGSAEVIWEIAEAGSERLVQDVAEAFEDPGGGYGHAGKHRVDDARGEKGNFHGFSRWRWATEATDQLWSDHSRPSGLVTQDTHDPTHAH